MYVRFFDVDYNETNQQAIPVAPIQLPQQMDTSLHIVPVIFITQKTIANLKEKDTRSLAGSICGLIGNMLKSPGINPAEIQIDCDWTAGSKDMYFQLLHDIREQPLLKDKLLSCTIRMHQVKYSITSGIPPVDRGMLMCYSMGDLKKPGAVNSILDAAEARDYLKRLEIYPMPLDIALPLFQWCILFRERKFVGILHEVSPDMLSGNKLFRHSTGNLYTCLHDTVWSGYPLRTNDEVRAEAAAGKDLEEVAVFTSRRLMKTDINVTFFSCDSITLSKYSTDELETVYNTYR